MLLLTQGRCLPADLGAQRAAGPSRGPPTLAEIEVSEV